MNKNKITKLLIANRGEIAIRVMRAATELGIKTVAIYSQEDKYALHRHKADESYKVGNGKNPIDDYLDIDDIIRIALGANVDAIHPGYGFLSENPELVEACDLAGITFVGPPKKVMEKLGSKVEARKLAAKAKVKVMPATNPLPISEAKIKLLAKKISYPLMVKATWGGGGRGMRAVYTEDELISNVNSARREAEAAFGNGQIYLEKLVVQPRHVEVQILGDKYGNFLHLFERDCTIQRRHQKILERAPAVYLNDSSRLELCKQAVKIAEAADYINAGTVEFLQDTETNEFYFIEVNPRIQVEHTVTESVTGIDLIQAQIKIAEGEEIGTSGCFLPDQGSIQLNGHAIQCRITTEDPENNFSPDHGRISAYRSASGFGIRLDAGTAFTGALITPYYDSLLVKVTAWAPTAETAARRMDRALKEFRIRGVKNNLFFLNSLINHPNFIKADYTTSFIDKTPELIKFTTRRDRATRLLNFIGDIIVNGNPDLKDPNPPIYLKEPLAPEYRQASIQVGTKQIFDNLGPDKFTQWILKQNKTLITDTTMRDAHQSLLATRVRTKDLLEIAGSYAELLPSLFSMECWGGATFDVAMRFLRECPWERLQRLRLAVPNVLLQMLLRGSNGVGYKNYPDNAVSYFIDQAAENGVDIFRIFDSLNWVENMKVSIDSVLSNNKICEVAICYTGDITDPNRKKYNLKYYEKLAKEITKTGAHIIGVKDMAGLCKPEAADKLVKMLKNTTNLPIHFHTHDTSGISGASGLAAIAAGADIVDAAMDSMSGLTSQPSLGAIVEALKNTKSDTGLDSGNIRKINNYWENVRSLYSDFEAPFRSGSSDVYHHEIPGGQYTNLRQQALSMGLGDRWSEIANIYADVNEMFGDIIKVTPTSKVVGDMTLLMVNSGITKDEILNGKKSISFPESVVSFFMGELGQPVGGFPSEIKKKILKRKKPNSKRPGSSLKPLNLTKERKLVEEKIGRKVSDEELGSFIMYPDVFIDYAIHRKEFGNVSNIPSKVFFFGMEPGDEISVNIERGKTLIIRFLATGELDKSGYCTVFFELNGQPRSAQIKSKKSITNVADIYVTADENDPNQFGAPMPGTVCNLLATEGKRVKKGQPILTIEAMKIETIVESHRNGVLANLNVSIGDRVKTKDLLFIIDEQHSQ